MIRVELTRIDDNPYQSRLEYGDLADLTASFMALAATLPETSGLLQVPLARLVLDGRVVDPLPSDIAAFLAETPARVELAYGHRRKRAFQQLVQNGGGAAFATFPVTLAVLDDPTLAALAWEENEKRKDISDIERAVAIEKALTDFGWTQAEIGRRWGIAQGTVANLLRLLTLPDKVRGLIREGVLTGRHGRALLPLVDIQAQVADFLALARPESGDELPSVARLEQLVGDFVAAHTYDLQTAPWAEDWLGAGLPSCAACEKRVRVGREWRCSDAACHHARHVAYKTTVKGPAIAVDYYNRLKHLGWNLGLAHTWGTCCGCGRAARDFEGTRYTHGQWLNVNGVSICPQCAELAQLRPCAAKSAPPAPEVYRPTPSDPKSLRRDEAAEYFPAEPPPAYAETVERGDPDAGFAVGEDEDGDGFGAGYVARAQAEAEEEEARPQTLEAEVEARQRSTLPAPQAKVVYTSASLPAPTLTRPAPVVVLTARIMPPSHGEAFDARRVLVSIGNEGGGPAAMRSGAFGDIGVLIGEALHAHFPEMQSEE